MKLKTAKVFCSFIFYSLLVINIASGSIEPIPDDSVDEGAAYTGPTPTLSQGTLPVTWSLQTGPSGMVIDAATGVVSWTNPIASGSPHTVTIEATNAAGSDQTSWQLTVNPSVKAWEPVELTFESQDVLEWYSFPLQVTFTNGAKNITLDGYWDGGYAWRVRFAPTDVGVWSWISASNDNHMDGLTGTIVVTAPDSTDIDINPNRRGHVRVSSNSRYFEYDDGTPFFWIGDTNWGLPYDRCGVDNGNFYTYLNDRIGKKFTVIQIQYLSPAANNEGGIAISSYPVSWSVLNPNFFQSIDIRIHEIWKKGLVVAGHPTWFSEFSITLKEAKQITRYILARYGAYNIILSLTGDYQTSYLNPDNDFTKEDYDSLGEYIQRYNSYSHPVSIHPRSKFGTPLGVEYSSSREFHNSSWLDHNWIQTYFFIDAIIPQVIRDYNLTPTKPVVLSEGIYEAQEPQPEHAQSYDVVDRYLSRLQAWSAYLNGAAGYSYGASGVWHMYDPAFQDPGIHHDYTKPWYENLSLPGSADMQHIRSFFSSLEWNTFEPLRSWLLVNGQTAALPSVNDFSPPSALGRWADTYVVYIPKGNTNNNIEIANLGCKDYTAQWFNPRNAQYSDVSDAPSFVSKWTIPPRPDMEDWVILLKTTNTLPPEILPPIIDSVPDDTAQEGNFYNGQSPVLLQGESCVTWTLVSAPSGMEIDATTGVVSWPNPSANGSPFDISIRAMNTAGADEQSWLLNVNPIGVIDNTDSGFLTVGSWGVSSFTPGYYGGDYKYAAAGSGSKKATWLFSVPAGWHDISARWAAFDNRASNAIYRVYNNSVEIGMQVFDQRIDGGRFKVFDSAYLVEAGTLEVVLTDNADGYVIADAVQLVFLGSGGNLAPNGVIETPAGDVTIAVGETVNFTGTGNDPDNDLPLSYNWDFGDPAITDATVEDPGLVQFNNQGSFTVTFTATDSQGLSDPTPDTVVVNVQTLSPSVIVDNNDAGFSTVGSWGRSSFTPGYYASDYRYAAAGSGSRQAIWLFSVAAGQHDISARWAAFDNRASNAVYRVYNNGVEIGMQVFDQRIDGGQFKVFDSAYVVEAGTLEVVLTDNADGYVIADAVQLVFLGSGGNLAPNGVIETPAGDVTIAVGETVNFTGTGNDPDNDLPLSYNWNFGDPAITDAAVEDPGLVKFNNQGSFTVTFTVTDSQGLPDPIPDTVVVKVQTLSPSVIVDNNDAGFSTVSNWGRSSFTPGYFGSDYRYAAAGSGSRQARWLFSVVAGQHDISARWAAFDNRASNAVYRVYNNGVEIGMQVFDQRIDGGQFKVFDSAYVVEAGTLEVVLTDNADGYVIADAVQLVFME